MMFQDDAFVTFKSMKELQDFITDVEKTIKFYPVEMKKLRIKQAAERNSLANMTFEDLAIYTDTTENSKVVAFYDDKQFYVGLSAVPTMQERCGCAGSYFSTSRRELLQWYTDTINKAAQLTKRNAVMYFALGKLRSFWSTGYAYIAISEILESTMKKMPGTWEYKSGWWNHEFTVCEFTTTDQELLKPYLPFFEKEKQLSAYMVISTSNTTSNGVNINFGLDCGYHIPLNIKNEFAIKHTGNASIDRFRDNLTKCFSLFQKRADEVFDKMNIPIFYPTGCLKEIFKKVNGIPLNIKAETIRYFQVTKPQGGCTGIDIYFAICAAIQIAKENGVESQKLMLIEEACSRAAALNFSDYDVPDTE